MAGEATGQNRTALTAKQERAALLLAEDELSDEQIAAEVGIARSTLAVWKEREEIAARIVEHEAAFATRIARSGYAKKAKRIKRLDKIATDLLEKLDDGDYEREDVKLAPNGMKVTITVIDNATITQVRGLFDDIAKELGERKQETVTKHTGTIAVEDARERLADLVARHAAAADAGGVDR